MNTVKIKGNTYKQDNPRSEQEYYAQEGKNWVGTFEMLLFGKHASRQWELMRKKRYSTFINGNGDCLYTQDEWEHRKYESVPDYSFLGFGRWVRT